MLNAWQPFSVTCSRISLPCLPPRMVHNTLNRHEGKKDKEAHTESNTLLTHERLPKQDIHGTSSSGEMYRKIGIKCNEHGPDSCDERVIAWHIVQCFLSTVTFKLLMWCFGNKDTIYKTLEDYCLFHTVGSKYTAMTLTKKWLLRFILRKIFVIHVSQRESETKPSEIKYKYLYSQPELQYKEKWCCNLHMNIKRWSYMKKLVMNAMKLTSFESRTIGVHPLIEHIKVVQKHLQKAELHPVANLLRTSLGADSFPYWVTPRRRIHTITFWVIH